MQHVNIAVFLFANVLPFIYSKLPQETISQGKGCFSHSVFACPHVRHRNDGQHPTLQNIKKFSAAVESDKVFAPILFSGSILIRPLHSV